VRSLLTSGLRRRWANRQLNTFAESLEAFRTAMSYRFFHGLTENRDVFIARFKHSCNQLSKVAK
jgi:hypothetical protein